MAVAINGTRRIDELANTIEGSGDNDLLIIRLGDGTGTKNIKLGDLKKIILSGFANASTEMNFYTEVLNNTGAGLKNSVWRGKNLGSQLTEEQSAAIRDGSFNDLWLGDYWEIDGTNYRIMDFDYYYKITANVGGTSTSVNDHHVLVVPDKAFYTTSYNSTKTTDTGYYRSNLKTTGLAQATTKITNAFGDDHILQHPELFTVSASGGKSTGLTWYNTTVDLMTEEMVTGTNINGGAADAGAAGTQLAGFVKNKTFISSNQWYWLRNIADATAFAVMAGDRRLATTPANSAGYVRPYFLLY